MNTKVLVKRLAVAIGLVCVLAGLVQADKLALQKKLGENIKIQLKNVTIFEAMEQIEQKAGVKFVLSDEAEWKLPQGKATRLSVTMDGALADSMTEMLNAFFMRYAVGDQQITVYPRPELDHVLGRPTTKQLGLLKAIYTRATEQYVESLQNTVRQAIGEPVAIVPLDPCRYLDEALHELSYQEFSDHSRLEDYKFKLPGPMTVANMLQHGVVETPYRDGGTLNWKREKGHWYLSDAEFPYSVAEIRFLNEPDFREAKLDQVVDISFKDESAELIIQRLAKWAGMELRVDKGDLAWLSEKISVNMQNITLRQALRNVVSSVDGGSHIDVEDSQIEIAGPLHEKEPAPSKTTEAEPGDYVGKISIPMEGGAYYIEFMLREKDLTDELRKLWNEKMKEVLTVPTLYDITAEEPEKE
jgi:hypothetical protein